MEPQPSPIVAAQESVERAEFLRTTQKMAEEIRALQVKVEAMHAARSLIAKDGAALEGLKRRLDAVKTETGAAIAELADKVEHMHRETTAKLSQVSGSSSIGQNTRLLPTSRAVPSASGVGVVRKQPRKRHDDAFDPSQNPGAPGVPRPLGSLARGREN